MAITKSFNGSTISKPGAYSEQSVDNSAGSGLSGAIDTIFLIGEAVKGAPGSIAGIVEYPSTALRQLIADFGSGPLVDCAVAACSPALAGQNIGGAGTIYVYKTNHSTDASVILKTATPANLFTVNDDGYGEPGNLLSILVAAGSSGKQVSISTGLIGGTTEILGQNPANEVLSIQYTGNGTAAVMQISGISQSAKILSTTLTGQSDSSANLSIPLANYTMSQLVAYINMQPGYVASMSTVSLSQVPSIQLDALASTSILAAQQLYMLQYEILNVINSSQRVNASINSGAPIIGIPAVGTFALSGGSQGGSSNSDFSTGLANSLSVNYNSALICISRDASVDSEDPIQGFTDPSSTYDIESVTVALDQHLQLRGNTQNRMEAQGFSGYRNIAKANVYSFCQDIGDYYMQICMQDVLFLDATGTLRYMHPHVTAALAMGTRAGQDVGEPLTFKYMNVQQIGHYINPITGMSEGDFNPSVDFPLAINAGVLFMENVQGGNRWVVDNTTYGIDQSFIYNRGSVIAAAQYVNRYLRQTIENIFVGHRIANGAASSIKNAVRNALRELNAPDVNIITSSAGAPEGFKDDATFIVTIVGNAATVQVEYIPVQGLDFVFFEFTIGDIQQSA